MLPSLLRVAVRTLLTVALPALLCVTFASTPPAQEMAALQKTFEELDAKQDAAGLREFWRKHPGTALYVIDSYLEGSMKLLEKKGEANKIAAMQQLGLRGAKSADEALGKRIFSDYAASFIGWDEAQRKRFRGGQKAYGESGKALKKGDGEAALKHGKECLELARPLGDWWGTGMGYTAVAEAQEKLGKLEEAVEAHAQAWLIHGQLGLSGDEYGNVAAMARLLAQLGRKERARVCVAAALELATTLGDTEGKPKLEELAKTLAN
jgi:tetratricopeptide (TPR) repeat protein